MVLVLSTYSIWGTSAFVVSGTVVSAGGSIVAASAISGSVTSATASVVGADVSGTNGKTAGATILSVVSSGSVVSASAGTDVSTPVSTANSDGSSVGAVLSERIAVAEEDFVRSFSGFSGAACVPEPLWQDPISANISTAATNRGIRAAFGGSVPRGCVTKRSVSHRASPNHPIQKKPKVKKYRIPVPNFLR